MPVQRGVGCHYQEVFHGFLKTASINFGSTPTPVRPNHSNGPPQTGVEMGALYTGGYNQASYSHLTAPQTYIVPGAPIAPHMQTRAPNSMQPHYGYPSSSPMPMQATNNEKEEHSSLQEQPPPYDKHEYYKSVG